MKRATNFVIVDPSLRSSGVLVSNGLNVRSYAITSKSTRLETLGLYLKHFSELAFSNNWDFLAIESYSFGSHSRSLTVQAEIGGIIRACFSAEKVPVIEIPIPTWKSVTGIRLKKTTKSDKKAYTDAVFKKYGVQFDTTDEADTYLMYQTLKAVSRGKTSKGAELKKTMLGMGVEV